MSHTPQGHTFTEIVIEIFKLSGLLVSEGDRITREYGLNSARWKILGALARSETELTVPQIARMMGQARQSVQRLVDIMHEGGLLALLDNPNHKRAKLVALTDCGETLYSQLEKQQIPWANEYAMPVDLHDLEITLATLKRISQMLDDK